MAGSSTGAFMGSGFFGGSNGDHLRTPSQSPSFLASNTADPRTPLTTINSTSFTGIHQKLDSLLGHTVSNKEAIDILIKEKETLREQLTKVTADLEDLKDSTRRSFTTSQRQIRLPTEVSVSTDRLFSL